MFAVQFLKVGTAIVNVTANMVEINSPIRFQSNPHWLFLGVHWFRFPECRKCDIVLWNVHVVNFDKGRALALSFVGAPK